MKTRRNISSAFASAILALALGCAGPTAVQQESPRDEVTTQTDARGFDPLELPRDCEIIPAKHPRAGDIAGKRVIVEAEPADPEMDSSVTEMFGPVIEIDSLNGQAYRVQIFTSRVYGDARRTARVAEEIFDQPVYVDYQVPNYKVRVGNFVDRDGAESYQQKAKTAGYTNAWVVMVNIGIKEVAPLYDDETGYFLPLPEVQVDTITAAEEEEEGSDSED